MDFDHIPARDHVASRELFQDHVGRGTQVHGIELHQVARLLDRIILGLAQGPGPSRRAAASPETPQARTGIQGHAYKVGLGSGIIGWIVGRLQRQ